MLAKISIINNTQSSPQTCAGHLQARVLRFAVSEKKNQNKQTGRSKRSMILMQETSLCDSLIAFYKETTAISGEAG